jgi:hypothetical protein
MEGRGPSIVAPRAILAEVLDLLLLKRLSYNRETQSRLTEGHSMVSIVMKRDEGDIGEKKVDYKVEIDDKGRK